MVWHLPSTISQQAEKTRCPSHGLNASFKDFFNSYVNLYPHYIFQSILIHFRFQLLPSFVRRNDM